MENINPARTNPMNKNIVIKGIKEGLLVSIGDGCWEELCAHLIQQIDLKPDFFKGAMLVLDVGFRVLHPLEVEGLRVQLISRGLGIAHFITDSPTTKITLKTLGLDEKKIDSTTARDLVPLNTQLDGENALLINRTLRSGNKIHYPGHVVVIGDVNPGSEIIASGSVVIWGRLKGQIHAGAEGDIKAVICALEIDKANITIARITELTQTKKWKKGASIILVENNTLILKNWLGRFG